MWFKILFIASFCILNVVSRPNGAPLTACEDMTPRHMAFQEQLSALPVVIEVNTPIVSGQPTVILISGNDTLPSFGGFQIQARTQNNDLIGTFQASEVVGVTNCRNISGSSATHVNTAQKTAVKITWTPPIVQDIIVFNFQ